MSPNLKRGPVLLRIVKANMAKKLGRPSEYTQELADTICEQLSLGMSLRKVCLPEEMPEVKTIFNWFRKYPDFLQQYEHATAERTEYQQEQLIDMGDEAIAHAQAVDFKASNAVVSAYKLKADNLKWSMSKMKPKKYGDKLDLTSGGEKLPTPIYNGQSTGSKD